MFNIFIYTLIALNSFVHLQALNTDEINDVFQKEINKKSDAIFSFKDYMKKFDATTVKEMINKKKIKHGLHISRKQEDKLILDGIDPTDEILGVKVIKGTPKIRLSQDGRRRLHLNFSESVMYDRYSNKARVEELMKAAIYQARDKMIVMQKMRENFKDESLYKMGFLTAKLDNLSKIFYKVGRAAYRTCTMAFYHEFDIHIGLHVMSTDERLIGLYFELMLLTDLYLRNIKEYEEVFEDSTVYDIKEFEFDDSRDETAATLPDITLAASAIMP